MNDYFASIVHADRMAEFVRDADRSRRAALLSNAEPLRGRNTRGLVGRNNPPILWLGIVVVLSLAAAALAASGAT
jgi:hypothetical protein